jgi:hypothetical protein
MSQRHFYLWSVGCLSACAAGWALPAKAQYDDTFGGNPGTNAFIRIPKDTDDWTRHFRVGALMGMNIRANFSMNGSFGISGNNPAAGVFDDGYVLKDQSGSTQYTGNWGYDNASQLSGSTLSMHATSSFTPVGGGSLSDSGNGGLMPGLDVAYGGNLWYWRHARVGWELGFGWLPVGISDNFNNQPIQAIESTYTFKTGGIVVPGAPYQGGFSGSGEPLIPYPAGFTPSSTVTNKGTLSGSHTLDATLYTLRLGPSIYWDLPRRFGLALGAGPAVGLVDGKYKYNETITTAGGSIQNSGSASGTDFVFGGYVNGTLLYHLQNNGDLYLGAQYMPMTDATINGGGRQGRLNLDGQLYFSVGLNWPF